MKIILATDAWHPQINGVVRTLSKMVEELKGMGHKVEVIGSGDYPSIPLPSYPEIKISIWLKGLSKRIEDFDPDVIHIATEGPIGQLVRRHCLKKGYTFTTSFHTRFPEYINERIPIPLKWTYPLVRNFHRPAFRTLTPTQNLVDELSKWDFKHLTVWGRGVDTELFHPDKKVEMDFPRPIMVNVGRIAPEKNIEAFLQADVPGTKIVVGDGPALTELKQKYPEVHFPGMKHGAELAEYYASADVFVFPSLTDTFGLVMLEANSSCTPVAAFPVTGPVDVLQQGVTGVMDDDLASAIKQALKLDGDVCRDHALKKSWKAIANQMKMAFMPIHGDKANTVLTAQQEA